jgi:uncharacterized membrane protein
MIWDAIRWLHLLAMGFFVGGQLMLAAVVVPALRGSADPAAIRAVARRFGTATLVAIAVLAVTGAGMASHFGRWSDPTLHAKLVLIVVVLALVLWHARRPEMHALEALIFLGSLAVVWLGVALAH